MNVICIDHGATERVVERVRQDPNGILFYRSTDGKHVTGEEALAHLLSASGLPDTGRFTASARATVKAAAKLLCVP